jgi:glutaredoxin
MSEMSQRSLLVRNGSDSSRESTLDKEPTGFFSRLWSNIVRDFLSYLSEYGFNTGDLNGDILLRRAVLASQINGSDVVVIAKIGECLGQSHNHSNIDLGCGFCERAKVMLAEQNQIPHLFSQEIVIGTDKVTRSAVEMSLKLGDVTFPQIIIRGTYVGGCDNLRELIGSGQFLALLRSEKIESKAEAPVPWYPPLEVEAMSPKLLTTPSKTPSKAWPWFCFQTHMYSNLVRYMSIFHSMLLLLALVLASIRDGSAQTKMLVKFCVYMLIYDLSAIVLHGPAPFSVSGTLGTYFGWKYRGNITSSLPYKFVFAFYLVALVPLVVNNNTGSDAAIASYTSELINSAVLVVFRF